MKHLLKCERYKLPSFVDYHNSYSTHIDRKARGGVSCFIKSLLLPFVSEINKDSSGHIRLHFTNGNIVFCSYIAPVDSPYCDPVDFCNVANAFVPTNSKCTIFGGGDLNGRVGDVPQTAPPPNGMYRSNCDTVVNEHGKEIMNICESFSCYVINNLNIRRKHFDGEFTFRKGNRKSQNDIILANRAAISTINEFTIHKEGWNPSDHAPVSVQCRMTFTKQSMGVTDSLYGNEQTEKNLQIR